MLAGAVRAQRQLSKQMELWFQMPCEWFTHIFQALVLQQKSIDCSLQAQWFKVFLVQSNMVSFLQVMHRILHTIFKRIAFIQELISQDLAKWHQVSGFSTSGSQLGAGSVVLPDHSHGQCADLVCNVEIDVIFFDLQEELLQLLIFCISQILRNIVEEIAQSVAAHTHVNNVEPIQLESVSCNKRAPEVLSNFHCFTNSFFLGSFLCMLSY